MILFFVLLLMVSLVVFLIGRGLSRVGQSDAHRVELLLSGEALTDHYRPLEKLLQKTDSQYLSAQPGVTEALVRHFRSQRRKIFRQYLSSLVSDFGVLCFLVQSLMVQSAIDRPDLSIALRKLRTAFYFAVVKVHFRLLVDATGFPPVSIDARDLIRVFDSLSAQARTLQISTELSLA